MLVHTCCEDFTGEIVTENDETILWSNILGCHQFQVQSARAVTVTLAASDLTLTLTTDRFDVLFYSH
eukprot:TRINITY_DN22_c1_g1_i1.p1 TRINITY_DN22_c1_g1~~TRINITY_DN22_c1_g1_i1.p1  ORF type:complete len:67 (-),score=8.37 TRINITY_DN22_c1_g1_i1:53-253(-)